jgi:hypothetical protein
VALCVCVCEYVWDYQCVAVCVSMYMCCVCNVWLSFFECVNVGFVMFGCVCMCVCV